MPDDKDAKMARSLTAAGGKKGPLTPPKNKGGLGNLARSLNPDAHRRAEKPAEVEDGFDPPCPVAFRMGFVGAGQGGSKIAQAFWSLGYRRVGAFNTTENDFAGLDEKMPKLSLQIGGAAKDMKLARDAFASNTEDVWDLFTRSWGTKVDCVLVCVGLGGGTGSGSALPMVNLARKYLTDKGLPPRVGAVVSLPSVEDGQQVARNAVTAFRELVEAKVSPLIVIDNDRVHELYNPPYANLLPTSNEVVSGLFHLFNRLADTRSPHMTFDRSEFAQILDSGIVVMGSANIPVEAVTSPADVSSAIKSDLANSVLADVDLKTGRKAACIFVASDDVLNTFGKDYFAAGFTMLNRIVGAAYPEGTDVVLHRGIYSGDEDGLQCYTMVGELDPPKAKLDALVRVAGLPKGPPLSGAEHLKVD